MNPVINLENVYKRFGRVQALNGLSLQVKPGTIFGLIGPNGAGKTTTVRITAGIIRCDSGLVEVFGENPWDNIEVKSRIGVLHERVSYPKNLKVLDFLTRVANIYGVSDAEKRALEVLKLVDLVNAKNRAIKGLSAGMLQKLGLAQAIVHDPELVIADEPTANLDPLMRRKVLELIRDLHRELGVTFVISSHILPELALVCRDVAFIHKGRVYYQGDISDISSKLGGYVYRIICGKAPQVASMLKDRLRVKDLEYDERLIRVYFDEDPGPNLFIAIGEIAKEIRVKVESIESSVVGLEELFRRAVRSG
ncbi:MAG: ABC transporter ATP-binding protein [Thermoprotei archaeon]|nr:MAG: multidrug ABC transporter ATP-binding protein [Thermofilum sp. ex4484_79]RLE58110.1 MAG: ABC transporter ATP-binding protein [Thermoprotei archaeon]